MNTTLGITGLLPKFQGKMYSVTEVAASKPAPDVFLHAARRSGCEPSLCAVIEDTPTAHHTFGHMRDLPDLLGREA
jgi:HAD superfamily hydrolase (TIGR01509 family)